MLNPQESFANWLMVLQNASNSILDFETFLPDIERFVRSIIETDEMPDPLKDYKNDFISCLYTDVVFGFFNMSSLSENMCNVVLHFFQLLIDLAKYGIKTNVLHMILLEKVIVENPEHSLYKNNAAYGLYEKVCQYSIDSGFFSDGYDFLKTYPNSPELIKIVFLACHPLIDIVKEISIWDFYAVALKGLYNNCKENLRMVPTDSISSVFNNSTQKAFKLEVCDKGFVMMWLDIISLLLKSDIFDKQLNGLKGLAYMISFQCPKQYVLEWFRSPENIEIISGNDMHSEFIPPYNNILKELAANDLLTDTFLIHLWNLHVVQHSSQLFDFFMIFNSIATRLNNEMMNGFVQMCLNPESISCIWIQFITNLAETLGSRNDSKEAFLLIRDKLQIIAFKTNDSETHSINSNENIGGKNEEEEEEAGVEKSNNSISTTIIQAAQDAFSKILPYYITSEELLSFTKSLFQFFGNSLIFYKVLYPSTIRSFNNEKFASFLISNAIDFAAVNPEDDHELSYNFILNLCDKNKVEIPEKDLPKLFSLSKTDESFYEFAGKLVFNCWISFDYIDKYIEEKESNEITEKFFIFVKGYIQKTNNMDNNFSNNSLPLLKELKALPFEKETILWKLSTIQSKFHHLFARFLCEIYASNDEILLSDQTMIKIFFEKWNDVCSQKQINGPLLSLIKIFIKTIEYPLDISLYGITRHDPSLESSKVQIKVIGYGISSPQTHNIPDSLSVSAVKHRISHIALIPMNKFKLFHNQCELSEQKQIRELSHDEPKPLIFTVKLLDGENNNEQPYHERTCIPSSYIISQPKMSNELLNLLKIDDYSINHEAKNLLNYLPTNISTLLKIKEIEIKQHFDYAKLLPIEYPSIFTYNLEAISSKIGPDAKNNDNKVNQNNTNLYLNAVNMIEFSNIRENFERTGGFLFLANKITKELIDPIITFLQKALTEELKKKFGQILFNAIYPFLLTESPEESLFLQNVNFLIDISSFSHVELPIQFYDSINTLLLSSKNFVKENGKLLLSKIYIPIEVFINNICDLNSNRKKANNADDNQSSQPINKNDPNIYENLLISASIPHINKYIPIFFDKFKENPHNFSVLSAIEKMVTSEFLPEDSQSREEIKEELTKILIDEYLTVDNHSKNSELFKLAVSCLSQIQSIYLLQHLFDLHKNRLGYNELKINGDVPMSSPTGCSGLINLGATCFLNSTIQQFFAIQPLRKRVIEYKGDDPFMEQLRNLFARMMLYNGYLLSTEDLIKEWTGWDGEKMNPRIQQDVCEFVQILIDKLEKGLGEDFVRSLFGGTTVDKIEGISDKYSRNSDQPFYILTIPINKLNNLDESLCSMMNPDFLIGANQYHAEELDKKIDAKKYQKIGKLPPYLIIQLLRFSYDFSSWVRLKIDTPFEFPVCLDLSKFTCVENQCVQFKLRGIIMHSGIAQYGHYTSYIIDKATGKWRCFNDSTVSDVTEEQVLNSAYGQAQSKNAYLIFYERIDTENSQEESINVNESLRNQIFQEISLKNEYSLFCSSPYFDLFKCLARSNNINFAKVSLQYFFDTLPFTALVEKASDIATPLLDKMHSNKELKVFFSDYLNVGTYKYALVKNCPDQKLRKLTLELIDSLEPSDEDCEQSETKGLYSEYFLDGLFSIIEEALNFVQYLGEYFELIERLISKHPYIKNYAISHRWDIRFSQFVITDLNQFLSHNQNLKPSYFYSSINISSLFKILAIFVPSNSLFDYILNFEFFKNLMILPNNPVENSAIISLFQVYHSPDAIVIFIRDFAIHYGVCAHLYKLLQLLYIILGEESFDLIERCHFKTKDDCEFSASLACEAMINPSFRSILIQNMDKWLHKCLINENPDSRINTLYIIGFLIQSRQFTNNIPEFNTSSATQLYGSLVLPSADNETDENKKQEIIEKSNSILNYLFENVDSAVSMILQHNSNSIGITYIECIIKLGFISKVDICSHLISMVHSIALKKPPFDPQMREIIMYMSHNSPQLITFDFLMESMNFSSLANFDFSDSFNVNVYAKMIRFFESFECLIDEFNPNQEFVKLFVEYFAFSKVNHISLKFSVIEHFINRIAHLFPEPFIEYAQNNFESIVKHNYSILLAVLEASNKKMPILPHLASAVITAQYYSLDELVIKSFKLNSDNDMPDDINYVINIGGILNSPLIGNSSRELIWNLIFKVMPPYLQFRETYKYKGDWVNFTKYLLQSINNESETDTKKKIIHDIIECSKSSLESFSLAFPCLRENANNKISNIDFCSSIFKHEIHENDIETISNYLKFLFENTDNSQHPNILLPLVTIVTLQIDFILDVIEDVRDYSLISSNFEHIIHPLRILSQLSKEAEFEQSHIVEYLSQLKEMCQKLNIVQKIPFISHFIDFIDQCFLL